MNNNNTDNSLIEELKMVGEDRRFYVIRYYHAAAFYFAILAVGLNLILNADSRTNLIAFLVGFSLINALTFVLALQFKRIVYHYLDREAFLTEKLGFKKPPDLLWGYWAGIYVAGVSSVGLVLLTILKYGVTK